MRDGHASILDLAVEVCIVNNHGHYAGERLLEAQIEIIAVFVPPLQLLDVLLFLIHQLFWLRKQFRLHLSFH